jgi:glutamine synthetase
LTEGFGPDFVETYQVIKRLEQERFDAAVDKLEFARREYFGRL